MNIERLQALASRLRTGVIGMAWFFIAAVRS